MARLLYKVGDELVMSASFGRVCAVEEHECRWLVRIELHACAGAPRPKKRWLD